MHQRTASNFVPYWLRSAAFSADHRGAAEGFAPARQCADDRVRAGVAGHEQRGGGAQPRKGERGSISRRGESGFCRSCSRRGGPVGEGMRRAPRVGVLDTGTRPAPASLLPSRLMARDQRRGARAAAAVVEPLCPRELPGTAGGRVRRLRLRLPAEHRAAPAASLLPATSPALSATAAGAWSPVLSRPDSCSRSRSPGPPGPYRGPCWRCCCPVRLPAGPAGPAAGCRPSGGRRPRSARPCGLVRKSNCPLAVNLKGGEICGRVAWHRAG